MRLSDYTSAIMVRKVLLPWLPAVLMMIIIFGFSSLPSREMPHLGVLDLVVQKAGHVLGYGFLALAYWLGLRFEKRRWWLALLLAVVYAATDEFHQSFVPGRHSGWMDILVYDAGGALAALGLACWIRVKSAPLKRNK
jgi:VanZ family protein